MDILERANQGQPLDEMIQKYSRDLLKYQKTAQSIVPDTPSISPTEDPPSHPRAFLEETEEKNEEADGAPSLFSDSPSTEPAPEISSEQPEPLSQKTGTCQEEGQLCIRIFAAHQAFPVNKAAAAVCFRRENSLRLDAFAFSDSNGILQPIFLSPCGNGAGYEIFIFSPGYRPAHLSGIKIYPSESSLLSVELIPDIARIVT